MKIDWGLFQGNFKQIISRFTKELPQTFIGRYYSQYRNTVGNVDKVRYFDGTTYVINGSSAKKDGVTLGGYININIKERYSRTKYEPKGDGRLDPTVDPLFMHEYGHYLQSQESGWNYLIKYGLPSISSASKSKYLSHITDKEGNTYSRSTHNIKWFETDANSRAADYFKEHYGVVWGSDKYTYYKFPIKY